MSRSNDEYTARMTAQASISASSTASAIKSAETKMYRGLYIAQLKDPGSDNGSAQALQARGERLPSKDETA